MCAECVCVCVCVSGWNIHHALIIDFMCEQQSQLESKGVCYWFERIVLWGFHKVRVTAQLLVRLHHSACSEQILELIALVHPSHKKNCNQNLWVFS